MKAEILPNKTHQMSLKADLADQSRLGDTEWLVSKFHDVAAQYKEFRDHTLAAETLSLWSQRFMKTNFLESNHKMKELDLLSLEEEMDSVLLLVIDRWTRGDPSYILALRKAMQNLLVIREKLAEIESSQTIIPTLVTAATNYARDDPRIAFGSLEAMGRSSAEICATVKASLPPQFIDNAFAALVNESSLSGMIGRCLVVLLGTQEPHEWFKFVEPYVRDFKQYQAVMTYFFVPLLKHNREKMELFSQFYSLCKPISSLSVEIGILTSAKNAKLDVSEQIQSSSALKEGLSSISRPLRYDALNLLCGATRKLTTPVPAATFDMIIANGNSLMAEGEPKCRSDVYGAFRNLLLRVNTSKSQDVAEKFIYWVADWCAQSLLPGMPYRYLTMAVRLLELFCLYGFASSVLNEHTVKGLLKCVTSDFPDIREGCVNLLKNIQELPEVDLKFERLTERAFKLLQGSRSGDSGARLLEFLNARRPEADMGGQVASLLEIKLAQASENLTKASMVQSIHGYFIALRLVSPRSAAVIPLALQTWKICSSPLMSVAPEGVIEEVSNYCWKAVKESSLSIELVANKYRDGETDAFTPESAREMLSELARMLTEITHWGAFSAVPPAYIAVAKIFPEDALSIAWNQIEELKNHQKVRSVTRRSAGLPLLITSTLEVVFDDRVVDALFGLANLPFAGEGGDDLEMPQVHGMNCLRAVITDSSITRQTSRYVERCLELSLAKFKSPSWSLRNCAAMLFSSLFKRLFGVRELPVSASVFFQRYKRLSNYLSEYLRTAIDSMDIKAVYPALAILAKLQTISSKDMTLSRFWEPIVSLLGSPSWKIREMAARVVVSMTHESVIQDVVYELVRSLDTRNQNEMHGYGLAINALLYPRAGNEHVDFTNILPEAYKSSTLSVLEKIINNNKCMETSTELFKAWVGLGGRRRLVSFQELPQPKYLNPSIATFEAEQVKFPGTNVENYCKGWNPVLRKLNSENWTLNLAKEVLNDETQLPDLQAMCLNKLQLASDPLGLGDIALSLLSPRRPLSVRQEALVLAAKSTNLEVNASSFERWLRLVSVFGKDEAPVESRRAAVRSIKAFLLVRKAKEGFSPNDVILWTLFNLLSDEEETIREIAAVTVSAYSNIYPSRAPAVCEELLLPRIRGEFISDQLAQNLVEDAEFAKNALKNPDQPLFVVERESLFRDEIRIVKAQAKYCTVSSAHRDLAEKAGNLLNRLDFDSPLQANSNYELAVVQARIDALTKVVL